MKKLITIIGVLLTGITLSGCQSTAVVATNVDPFEGVNRVIFGFNQSVDGAILKPTAKFYKENMPKMVQNRVGDFMSNLSDISTLGNEILQFELRDSAKTLGRVLINSTIGLAGIFDVASDIGLEQTSEDFGQTMAVWGVPNGPYIVLPLLGPSTVRDSIGFYADVTENIDTTKSLDDAEKATLLLTKTVNTRVQLLPITDLLEKAPDPYTAMRFSYLQKRKYDVYNGNLLDDDDDDF